MNQTEKNLLKKFPVMQVCLLRERAKYTYDSPVNTPESAYKVAVQHIDPEVLDRETFAVIYLNTKNNPIGVSTVSIGTLSMSVIHPREVFKGAILANAAGIIIAHNHPSGNPDPSEEDKAATKRLRDAGELLGIELLDHIIIGGNGKYVSMLADGYM